MPVQLRFTLGLLRTIVHSQPFDYFASIQYCTYDHIPAVPAEDFDRPVTSLCHNWDYYVVLIINSILLLKGLKPCLPLYLDTSV